MPIDPVKIPQNVYVEDRIIGPITLRQIIIVMIGTGISYAIWAAMKSGGTTSQGQTIIAWIPAAIGVLFAFVKINGISLLRIILLIIEKLDKPSKRTWTPRSGIYVNIVTKPAKKKKSEEPVQKKRSDSKIEELSRVLDQGPPLEEDIEVEAVEQASKPVNPNRIKVDERSTPVDDIAPINDVPPDTTGGLLRDISPPPSHA